MSGQRLFLVGCEHTEVLTLLYFLQNFQPISSQYSMLIPPENVRNPLVF